MEQLRLTAKEPLMETACKANELSPSAVEKAALSALTVWPERAAFLQSLRAYDRAPRGPVQDPALVRQLYGSAKLPHGMLHHIMHKGPDLRRTEAGLRLPPLTLQEGGVMLSVSGKIDRVDGYIRGNTLYLKVVDYKTGKKEFRLSDVLYGLNLQMFLYLMMLKQSGPAALDSFSGCGGVQRTEPCGALYVPAKTPYLFREPGETDEKFQSRLDQELRRIGLVRDDGDLLEAMEHGGRFRFLPVSLKKDGSWARRCS